MLLLLNYYSWNRTEYRRFIAACERHGRNNLKAVCIDLSHSIGKDGIEIERYFKVTIAKMYL